MKNKVKKPFYKRVLFWIPTVIFCFIVSMCCVGLANSPAEKSVTENAETAKTTVAPATGAAVEKPEFKFIYWNGGEYGVNGVYEIRGSGGKRFYAVTKIPDYENFSDDDYLKTLELLENSEIEFLEIVISNRKYDVIRIDRISRWTYASYGHLANGGGIDKTYLYFIVNGGKVLRLTEKELDAWEAKKNK